MSELQSSHEIEDVVSSIRRLVSTQLRPRTRDLSHDKLLLTPALQVVAEVGGPYEPEAIVSAAPAAFVQPVIEEAQPQAEVTVAAVAEPVEQDEPVVADLAAADLAAEDADAADLVAADLVAADLAAVDLAAVDVAAADLAAEDADAADLVAADLVAADLVAVDAAAVDMAAVDAAIADLAAADLAAADLAAADLAAADLAAADLAVEEAALAEVAIADDASEEAALAEEVAQIVAMEAAAEVIEPTADAPRDSAESVAPADPDIDAVFSSEEVSTEAGFVQSDLSETTAEPLLQEEAEALNTTLHLIDGEWEDEIWEDVEPSLAELSGEIDDAEVLPPKTGAEVHRLDPWSAPEADLAASFAPPEAGWVQEEPIPFFAHARSSPVANDAAVASAAHPDAGLADDEQLSGGAAEALDVDAEEPGYSTIDEDVLTEIIRDLIREELQGALGERITRNVRKLVRAEINRALTARPYE